MPLNRVDDGLRNDLPRAHHHEHGQMPMSFVFVSFFHAPLSFVERKATKNEEDLNSKTARRSIRLARLPVPVLVAMSFVHGIYGS
jgi:hypothetical protein